MTRAIGRLTVRCLTVRFKALASLTAVAASAILALTAVSCESGSTGLAPDGQLTCPELSSKYFRDSTGDGHYRVVSPNGGESFKVGDSLKVRVTSGGNDSEAVVYLAITRNGTLTTVILPGSPSGNIDPRNRCTLAFLVPDSVRGTSGKKVPLVSDSVRIRIAKYNFETISDYSDGYFRVTP
ncbi:MAG: hypothetical protein M3Y08_17045 [Fibrobacterota bacterium]|nr:hypothetical protein [Fibrobacterota bacterium]